MIFVKCTKINGQGRCCLEATGGQSVRCQDLSTPVPHLQRTTVIPGYPQGISSRTHHGFQNPQVLKSHRRPSVSTDSASTDST